MATPAATTSQTFRFARTWHIAVAVIVLASLVAQFVLSLTGVGATDPDIAAGTRVIRFLSFFTIMSNILLCGMSITLAIKPDLREGLVWLFWYLDRRLHTSPGRVSPFVGSDGS
jgi:formate-dependent nitrite reductase membrane component NrfD